MMTPPDLDLPSWTTRKAKNYRHLPVANRVISPPLDSRQRSQAIQQYQTHPLPPQLVARVNPVEGEALFSWLVRLARANGFLTASALISAVSGQRQWLSMHPDAPNTTASEMEAMLGLPRALFWDMLVTREIDILGGERRFYFWGLSAKQPTRKATRRFEVCPRCIGTNPGAWMKSWRLGTTTHCDSHGGLLLETCIHCQTPFTLHLHRTTDLERCRGCWAKIADMPDPVNDGIEPSPFSRSLFRADLHRCFPVPGADATSWWQAIAWILRFACSSNGAAPLMRAVLPDRHAECLFRVTYRPCHSFISHDSAQRARLLSFAEWLLNPWPDRLMTVFEQSGIDHRFVDGNLSGAPHWLKVAITEPSPWRRQQYAQRKLPFARTNNPERSSAR